MSFVQNLTITMRSSRIDATTMEIHHDKHHALLGTKLNAAVEGTEYADKDGDLIAGLGPICQQIFKVLSATMVVVTSTTLLVNHGPHRKCPWR